LSTDHGRQSVEMGVLLSVQRMIAAAVLFNHGVAERVGLGASDSQFMTLLQVHGPLTPGRLAELSSLRTGTVTGVIDRLEQAGFVRRDRAPDDRRKVIVSLNDELVGQKIGPLYQGQAENLLAILRRYDDRDLAVIAGFLDTLVRERAR
jgi:hypothetical protein